jgi:hypothetical protein
MPSEGNLKWNAGLLEKRRYSLLEAGKSVRCVRLHHVSGGSSNASIENLSIPSCRQAGDDRWFSNRSLYLMQRVKDGTPGPAATTAQSGISNNRHHPCGLTSPATTLQQAGRRKKLQAWQLIPPCGVS